MRLSQLAPVRRSPCPFATRSALIYATSVFLVFSCVPTLRNVYLQIPVSVARSCQACRVLDVPGMSGQAPMTRNPEKQRARHMSVFVARKQRARSCGPG